MLLLRLKEADEPARRLNLSLARLFDGPGFTMSRADLKEI
jgi:hypothetical protein